MTLNASHAGQAHRYNSLKGTSNPLLPPWLITIIRQQTPWKGSLTGQVGQVARQRPHSCESRLERARGGEESQGRGLLSSSGAGGHGWRGVGRVWFGCEKNLVTFRGACHGHGPYIHARRCLSLRAQQPRARVHDLT